MPSSVEVFILDGDGILKYFQFPVLFTPHFGSKYFTSTLVASYFADMNYNIIKHNINHFIPVLYRGYLKIDDLRAHNATRF